MSNEGNADPEDGPTWEPVTDPGAEDRAEKIQEKQRRLDQKETELDRRESQLDEREAEIERLEDQVNERREKVLDEKESLDEREQRLENREETLDEREGRLAERAANLDEREKELNRRAEEIETQREALEEYGGGGAGFTARPRRVASVLLGVMGLVAVGVGISTYLAVGVTGTLGLFTTNAAIGVAATLIVVALVEFVGGYFAYRGRHYYTAVFAGIIAIAMAFPVGLAVMIMLGVGESQFD